MTTEETYKLTIAHVIKWLGGEGDFDAYKPVSARTANGVIEICRLVLEGYSLEDAVRKYSEGTE